MTIGALRPISSAALARPLGVASERQGARIGLSLLRSLTGPIAIGDPWRHPGAIVAKFAASMATPILIFWGTTQQVEDSAPAAWSDKSVWICNFGSFFDQYYPVPGYPPPTSIQDYLTGNYATLDPATDKLAVTDSQMQAKINAHAGRDAQLIADCLHKQGLLAGLGPYGGGRYGGVFGHHELFTEMKWNPDHSTYAFTSLLRHPDDAALVGRTQTLVTGPATTRESTLLKLSFTGQIDPELAQTTAGRNTLEAASNRRPGNYHHLICTNGIAAAKRYVDALRVALKAKCDSYIPPGGGAPIQLCYPAHVLHDLENFSGRAAFHQNQFINHDPPAKDAPNGQAGYYLIGVLWHVKNNAATWSEATIYKAGEGYATPVTYQSAIEGDKFLSDIYIKDAGGYAPTLSDAWNTLPPPATPLQQTAEAAKRSLHFRRIEYHAADYAIYEAFNAPWRLTFPHTTFSNYEFVVVKNESAPYKRPGNGGTESIQSMLRQDYQAPSCYGRSNAEDDLVEKIKNTDPADEEAVAAAVEEWNAENLPLVVSNILDRIESGRPTEAYVFGPFTPEDLRAGLTGNEWGGDAQFFKRVIKALWRRHIYRYIVYSGNAAVTYAAWLEVQAEIKAGQF